MTEEDWEQRGGEGWYLWQNGGQPTGVQVAAVMPPGDERARGDNGITTNNKQPRAGRRPARERGGMLWAQALPGLRA